MWQEAISASDSAKSWTAQLLGLLLRNTTESVFWDGLTGKVREGKIWLNHLQQRRDLILNLAVLRSAATLVIQDLGAFAGLIPSCFLTLAIVNELMLEKALLFSVSTMKQNPLQLKKKITSLTLKTAFTRDFLHNKGPCNVRASSALQHASLQPSWNHWTAEVGRDLWRSPSANLLLKAGSACPGLCPAGFQKSLRMETLQPHYATCSSAQEPLQ